LSTPRADSRLRLALRNGAHLTALSAFALAQPLLDILGKNAAFFAVRGSSSLQIVLFALVVTFALPAALLAVEFTVDLASHSLARAVHLLFVGGLSAVVVLHALTNGDVLSGVAALAAAGAVGALATAVYWRARVIASFLSVLAPAPLVFLALFLFDSPVTKLVFVHTPAVQAATVQSRTPVVVVIFDELSITTLMNRRGGIDAGRYPSFAALARNATWYRSASTVFWETVGAVPAILTGSRPKPNRVPVYSDYPRNLFTLLGKSYRLRVIETLTHLCPSSLCPDEAGSRDVSGSAGSLASDAGIVYLHLLVPDPYAADLPPISDSWGNFGGRARRVEEPVRRTASGQIEPCARSVCRFTDRLSSDAEPTLYFLHTALPHWPYFYLPSGRRNAVEARPLGGYKEGHWLATWPALQGKQRYLLQLGYTDRALGLILRRLHDTGLYDRALLIVSADHGVSFRGDDQRRRATPTNLDDVAFVPLFVKLPGQQKGRVVDGYARTIDILPTIARVLHVHIPWRVEGKPLVGRRLPMDGTVTVVNDGGPTSGRLSALRRKRLETLAQHVALFGTGSFAPVYRLGPHPELLGRRIAALTVRPSTAAVQLEGRSFLAAVDPDAEFVPTFLAGTISGKHPPQLDLALALNGRIAAVTKTFSQDGKTQFSAIFPESALRRGRNEVDVFAVGGAGTRLVLEQLRGSEPNLVLRERGGREVIESTEGRTTRVDPAAIAGSVEVSKTSTGFAFRGRARAATKRRLVDSFVVFADARAVFVGRAADLRPLRFIDKGSSGKDRFGFELPRNLLPAPGGDHTVRVFALRGRVASELRYVGSYPWGS
jgi:hypothetical protein